MCLLSVQQPFTWLKRTFASTLRPSDSYRTMHIACAKCNTLLFKYKKKNGTKSKLVKMYTARITFDPFNFVHHPSPVATIKHSSSTSPTPAKELKQTSSSKHSIFNLKYNHSDNVNVDSSIRLSGIDSIDTTVIIQDTDHKQKELTCPKCHSTWGRPATKAGHDIFKCIGGKIRMS